MKKILVYLSLIMTAACLKQQEDTKTRDYFPLASVNGKYGFIVYCEGSCVNGECKEVKDIVNKKWYCPCEGTNCAMVVQIVYEQQGTPTVLTGHDATNFIDSFITDREFFIDDLDAYIQNQYETDDYVVKTIEAWVDSDEYFIFYSFTIGSEPQESVLFNMKSNGQKFLVNCTGSCDDPAQKCVEEFGFGRTSINCACESDNCMMIIQQLEP